MDTLIRYFFYSVGFVLLFVLSEMNPDSAQFKDLIVIIHAPGFFLITCIVTLMLLGIRFVFSPMPAIDSLIAKTVVLWNRKKVSAKSN